MTFRTLYHPCLVNIDAGHRCCRSIESRNAPYTEEDLTRKVILIFIEGILKWCRHQDSNSGPTDYKSVALPTELYRHGIYQGVGFYVLKAVSAMFLDANFIHRLVQSHRPLPAQSHCHFPAASHRPPPAESQSRLPVRSQRCFPARFQWLA